MAQQTAIEYLLSNLPNRFRNAILNECNEEIEKAKAMEKEQINKACYDGYYKEDEKYTYEYYNETYGK